MSRVVRRPLSLQSQAIAKKAAQVAALYQHPYIDHAHFVMAFLEVPNCATQAISANRSAVLERVRKRTMAFLHSLPPVRADKYGANGLRASHRMDAILESAQHEAMRRNARHSSPRDLFLALATEDLMSEAERGSVAGRLLAPMDLAPHQIRRLLFPPHKRRVAATVHSMIPHVPTPRRNVAP